MADNLSYISDKLSYSINKVILPSLRNHKKIRGIQEELLG